jgi:hypothetical protein
MAQITTWMTVHEPHCRGTARRGVCDGCEIELITVTAEFEPAPDIRRSIARARRAAMDEAVRVVRERRS